MTLLCKKQYMSLFTPGKLYLMVEFDNSTIVEIYCNLGYTITFRKHIIIPGIYDKYTFASNVYDYFYTEEEHREIKLNKLLDEFSL